MTNPLGSRRPIRVSFTAKTLSGVAHLTDFVLPPVVGDDLISEVEVVLKGERTCRLAWSVDMTKPDPEVVTMTPAKAALLNEILDRLDEAREADDEDDDDDDDDDEADASEDEDESEDQAEGEAEDKPSPRRRRSVSTAELPDE